MNFRPHFDACISRIIQPIELKLKPLVELAFTYRWRSFLCQGCRINAVLVRHLAGRAAKVSFMVVGLPSLINLDSVAPSKYKSGFSLII